jgi:hypothetical protein
LLGTLSAVWLGIPWLGGARTDSAGVMRRSCQQPTDCPISDRMLKVPEIT